MLLARAIFALKIHLNSFVAGGSLGPTGAYSAPQTPSCFSAGRFAAEEDRKGEGKGGKRKGEGVGTFRHFFVLNLTTECSGTET